MKTVARMISEAVWGAAQTDRRAMHAAEVAKSRAEKKARGECRQCKNPVARALNGRPMTMCNEHLDADQARNRARRPPKGTRTPRKAIR